MMTKPKVVYSPKRDKPKVKHTIDTTSGTITSKVIEKHPKLKEAVGADVQQAAEETAHTAQKTAKPKEAKANEMTELDHKILQALDALGGKDIASIDMAKKVGTTRTHPDAPRAPIRHAMERFEKLGYVKSEKKGAKYLFTITDKGKHFLTNPPPKSQDKPKDKSAHNPAPASTISTHQEPAAKPSETVKERPANTDMECPKCHTFNPLHAEFCKSCGQSLRVKAAPVAA